MSASATLRRSCAPSGPAAFARCLAWLCRALVPGLLLCAALGAMHTRPARADELHVPVSLDPCVPVDPAKFRYLLGIELSADAAAGAEGQSAAAVAVSCDGAALVLTVQDVITRKQVTRRVDIGSVDPSARTRLLALTVAELVLASWMEVRIEPRPVIEPVEPAPPPAAKARVSELVEPVLRPSVPPLRLGASACAMTFFSAMAPVAGLGLHLQQPLSRAWALQVRLQGGFGTLAARLPSTGGAARQSVDLRITAAAFSLALGYTQRVGAFDLWAALSGLIGFAYLAGAAPQTNITGMLAPTPAYAPWAGPVLQLGAAYRMSERLRVFVQLEAGLLALGANVLARTTDGDRVVAQLRDGWLGGALGFDIAP